jgi:RNA polymerase sigma factor (sigma-70 family)
MVSRIRFEQLYREHAEAVLAYTRRRTTASSAGDVVIEVFLIAWRRLDEAPEAPRAWLLRIARRVLANKQRAEGQVAVTRDRNGSQLGASAPGRHAGDVESPAVRALRSLSAADQEFVTLIAWDGLDRAQTAEVLGISVRTLPLRLYRARRRLLRARAAVDATDPRSTGAKDLGMGKKTFEDLREQNPVGRLLPPAIDLLLDRLEQESVSP